MKNLRPNQRIHHKSLAKERPDLVRQWHPTKNKPLTPADVTAGVELHVWWKCPKGPDHVWRATIIRRAYRGNGCPFCANRLPTAKNTLAVAAPKVAREWHPTKNGNRTPRDVVAGSGKRAWWLCKFGHEWETSIVQRTRIGTGCPYCVGYRKLPERRLAMSRPLSPVRDPAALVKSLLRKYLQRLRARPPLLR